MTYPRASSSVLLESDPDSLWPDQEDFDPFISTPEGFVQSTHGSGSVVSGGEAEEYQVDETWPRWQPPIRAFVDPAWDDSLERAAHLLQLALIEVVHRIDSGASFVDHEVVPCELEAVETHIEDFHAKLANSQDPNGGDRQLSVLRGDVASMCTSIRIFNEEILMAYWHDQDSPTEQTKEFARIYEDRNSSGYMDSVPIAEEVDDIIARGEGNMECLEQMKLLLEVYRALVAYFRAFQWFADHQNNFTSPSD